MLEWLEGKRLQRDCRLSQTTRSKQRIRTRAAYALASNAVRVMYVELYCNQIGFAQNSYSSVSTCDALFVRRDRPGEEQTSSAGATTGWLQQLLTKVLANMSVSVSHPVLTRALPVPSTTAVLLTHAVHMLAVLQTASFLVVPSSNSIRYRSLRLRLCLHYVLPRVYRQTTAASYRTAPHCTALYRAIPSPSRCELLLLPHSLVGLGQRSRLLRLVKPQQWEDCGTATASCRLDFTFGQVA